MIQFKYGNNLDIFSLLYHINEKSVHKQTKTGRLSILASLMMWYFYYFRFEYNTTLKHKNKQTKL